MHCAFSRLPVDASWVAKADVVILGLLQCHILTVLVWIVTKCVCIKHAGGNVVTSAKRQLRYSMSISTLTLVIHIQVRRRRKSWLASAASQFRRSAFSLHFMISYFVCGSQGRLVRSQDSSTLCKKSWTFVSCERMNLVSEIHFCMPAHQTSVRNNSVNYSTINNNNSNENVICC